MNQYGFSDVVRSLRLAWDATVLSQYMRDPLSYFWRYVQGYGSPRVNPSLAWGTAWHHATGAFEAAVFRGATREQALRVGIDAALEKGLAEGMAVVGLKGDEAKRCVYSLARALIWWEQDTAARGWKFATNADGTPAIEVRFLLPIGANATTGEPFMLCGSFDGVVEVDGDYWVLERKSTAQSIGPYFWQTYDPCMQTYLYDYVAPQLYPDKRIRGVIVEALQTGVEFARCETHRIIRTDEQRLHWREVMLYWMRRAEQDAINNSWQIAVNTESVSYGSTFKEIQKRDPRVWQALLNTDCEKRELWNPVKM